MLAVPVELLGALGEQALRGLQNDVYCQIGLVMFIGLASKNAFLIVEFAEQLRAQGAGRISVGTTVFRGMSREPAQSAFHSCFVRDHARRRSGTGDVASGSSPQLKFPFLRKVVA